jgi:RNA polymerase sigma-70 factor (ECF subfamily)
MTEDGQKLDGELVHRILTGDETAFDALYKRHSPRLYRFIASKIDDRCDAEELVNDTFLKAKEHLHTLQEPEKVLNWMFRIAGQLVVGWHRRQKQVGATQRTTDVYEAEGEAAATAVIHQTAQEYTIKTERWTALSKAIAQLPDLEQKMFRLQLAGERYEKIAEICEVSASVVKNRLSRTKKKLKAWAAAWEKANAEGRDVELSKFNEKKGKS